MVDSTTSKLAITTVLRCAIDHVSMLVYQASRWRKKNDSLEECPPAAFGAGAFRKREHSMGVSVNETSNDTAMANAEVKPKELMNRPTIPPMNPTGRNTASSDIVVAITARPISFVPLIAASNGGMFFSSINR